MIVVINAGGEGTRLWPLSTPDYPKHLLKLTGDESLLQLAYNRARRLSDHVYVVTEEGHAALVRDQLPELLADQCIVEPARRGTAGCMLAGLRKVAMRHDHDEPIAFLHADHIIHDVDGFVYSVNVAAQASRSQNRITLVGIEPTFPATGFGYIRKGAVLTNEPLVYEVAGFTEKPPLQKANDYVQSGEYLWNCAYFVGSVNTFAHDLKQYSPQWSDNYQKLLQAKSEEDFGKTYLSLKTDMIDYALLEHDPRLLVVPASFDWRDIGSFIDLYQVLPANDDGNVVMGDHIVALESTNTLVRNDEPTKHIGVIGLDNVVVINTKHGLLVTSRDQAQKVKEVVNRFRQKS